MTHIPPAGGRWSSNHMWDVQIASFRYTCVFLLQTREAVFTLSAMTAGIRRNWIEVLKKSIRPNGSPDLTQSVHTHKKTLKYIFINIRNIIYWNVHEWKVLSDLVQQWVHVYLVDLRGDARGWYPLCKNLPSHLELYFNNNIKYFIMQIKYLTTLSINCYLFDHWRQVVTRLDCSKPMRCRAASQHKSVFSPAGCPTAALIKTTRVTLPHIDITANQMPPPAQIPPTANSTTWNCRV